jgi:peptidoglycan/xylan/chitin deacetylase (PgdA/CDA1 family)
MDVEQDISRYLKDSYVGVEGGLIPFLDLIKDYDIVIDFFVTGDICRRYPKLIQEIANKGHNIGCHGYDHTIQFYCKMGFKEQLKDISDATKEIEGNIGIRPLMFRAPNFSVNTDTIKALEQLGYLIDSSILPGRVVKKWKALSVYNHRSAPRKPYYPSMKNIIKEGESSVLEIPLTENPHLTGAPIGMGFLNYAGLEKSIAAISDIGSSYVTFLVHPWELVDLKKYHSNLKPWVYKICSSNLKPLESLLKHFMALYGNTTLLDIEEDISGH